MASRTRKDEPNEAPSPLVRAFAFLRSGWSLSKLARLLGHKDESQLSAYLRGDKPLTREKLDSLVEPMGHPPEAVDVLLLADELILAKPPEEPPSPLALTPEERRVVDRAALAAACAAGRVAAELTRTELIRQRRQEKEAAARTEAEELFQRLTAATFKERRALVEAFPDFWNWALAVRVCETSVRRAAHDAREALDWAELALAIADRVPGEPSWRSRLQGYCWAHGANARRVGNDLRGADEAFVRAWGFWRAGAESDSELLPEWLLFSFEASLRRAERRFSEALELLERARTTCGSDPSAAGRILLKRDQVFHLIGDIEGALATLEEAAPLVEISGDRRLLFALRFKTAKHFCQLERYSEAVELLPLVREMAIHEANELDLIRVTWLSAKVAAGQGQKEEAISCLEQVCRELTVRELLYDAALASLDLAVLLLNAGRIAEVRELATTMGRIFSAKGVHQEALAAFRLFCHAAQQETATVELARRAMVEIKQTTPPVSAVSL